MCGKNTKCNIGQAGEEFQAVGAEKVLTLREKYAILTNTDAVFICAGVAQSVEQLIRNQQVAGSSPVTSSNFSVTKVTEFFDFWRCLLMSEKEYRALRSALASTRMEGFEVTEQTEKDCIRLLSGDISVADLVKEIVSRPAKAV